MRPVRPRVLCNLAPSLDGKLAPARKHAPLVMSRHAEDPKRMRALRARADAVIIGAGNLSADDPDLMPSPLRVVVTRTGQQVRPSAKMFDSNLGGEAVVAHASTMPESKRASLEHGPTLVALGSSEVDLSRLLEWLAVERGCRLVVCEGGGILIAGLFAARAVDELFITIVPRILGGANAPTAVDGEGFEPNAIPDGHLLSVEKVEDEVFLHYEFHWS